MRLLPGLLSVQGRFQRTRFRPSLKCDMCEGEDEPLCVKWCLVDALTYEEREEEVEEEESPRRNWNRTGSAGKQVWIGQIIETVAPWMLQKRAKNSKQEV
jgi:benzoyl-CoA reductase subunit BamC